MKSQYKLSNAEIDDLVSITSRMYKSPIDLYILTSLLRAYPKRNYRIILYGNF